MGGTPSSCPNALVLGVAGLAASRSSCVPCQLATRTGISTCELGSQHPLSADTGAGLCSGRPSGAFQTESGRAACLCKPGFYKNQLDLVVDARLDAHSTISDCSDTSAWKYHTSAVVGNKVVAMPDNSVTILVVDAELGTHSTIPDGSDTLA